MCDRKLADRSWVRPGIAALTATLFCALVFLGIGANAATPCVIRVDGRDASTFVRPGNPLRVTDLSRPLELSGEVPRGTTSVAVQLLFWPVTVPISTPEVRGGGTWTAIVNPTDYQQGIGLYHIQAITNTDCVAEGWIRIDGDPLATLAGKGAAVAIGLGVLLQVFGLIRRSWWSVAGGVPTGAGIVVLLQQSGSVALDVGSLVIAVVSAVAVGGVASGLAHLRSGGRVRQPTPTSRQAHPTRATPPRADTAMPEPTPRSAEASTGAAPREAVASPAAAEPGQPPLAVDTPTQSFAKLDCDPVVVVGEEFELRIGLSGVPSAGVRFGVIHKPAGIVGDYSVSIHVVADGFERRADERWRQVVPITSAQPYPEFALHLTARPAAGPSVAREIKAYYSVAGEPVGFAERSVRVVANRAVLAGPAAPAPPATAAIMSLPTGQPTDLVLHISIATTQSAGQFLAILETRFDDITVPDAPFVIDLGADAKSFAGELAKLGNGKDGKPGLYLYMVGLGKRIGLQLDDQFYETLHKVYERVGKPPTLLISTEEPYVPWELAVLEDWRVLDGEVPPFLGAQAVVGRWVPGRASGARAAKPPSMPPAEIRVAAMAVVWGTYVKRPLVEAEREAHEITVLYQAVEVEASSVKVLRYLTAGDPQAELVHFAVHGQYDPGGAGDGLFLIDGNTLDPNQVFGATLKWAPFVFLNACQVGTASQVLGDYAGLAEAFLRAGASGVIAPLWPVQDTIAREIALRFYKLAFADISPAEALRRERASFKDSPDLVTATFLAYQYYGHPGLRFVR